MTCDVVVAAVGPDSEGETRTGGDGPGAPGALRGGARGEGAPAREGQSRSLTDVSF